MAAPIVVTSYPLDVTVRTRTVPVVLTLTGVLPQNLAVLAAKTNVGVSLYADLTVPVQTAPRYDSLGGGQYRFYLRLSPGWENNVLNANAITLYDTVSGFAAEPFYIAMTRNEWQSVTSGSDFGVSDDFLGTSVPGGDDAVSRKLWEFQTNEVVPQVSVAASILTIGHSGTVVNGSTLMQSEVYDGYPNISWRDWLITNSINNCAFRLSVEFFDDDNDLSAGALKPNAVMSFGFNYDGTVMAAADPTTTVRIVSMCQKTGGGGTVVRQTPVVLPGGAVTTVAHAYGIKFVGDGVEFYFNDVLLTTLKTNIPSPAARRFRVVKTCETNNLVAADHAHCDRVSILQDIPLAIAGSVSSSSTSANGLTNDATLVPTSSIAPPTAGATLAAAGGMWVGTSLDCANIPAVGIDFAWVWTGAVGTAKGAPLYVVWSNDVWTGIPDALDPVGHEYFVCKPGNGGLTVDTVGGMTLLRNRKRRYLTLMAFNGDGAKTIDITVNTYALGAPVEEFDSSKTGTISSDSDVLVVNLDAVFKADAQVGARYLIRVVGGDGICLRTDGNTVTAAGGMPFYDGDTLGPFVATAKADCIQAIKRTAGTSNASVIIVSLDNQ